MRWTGEIGWHGAGQEPEPEGAGIVNDDRSVPLWIPGHAPVRAGYCRSACSGQRVRTVGVWAGSRTGVTRAQTEKRGGLVPIRGHDRGLTMALLAATASRAVAVF